MAEFSFNFKSLREIIVAEEAATPIVIRTVTPAVQRGQWSTEGPMQNPAVLSNYVRIESLPKELQERVRTAIEALVWA